MHLQEALATQRQVSPATLTRHWKRMGYVYKRTRSVPAGHRSQDFRRCFACWLACGLRVRYLPHYSSHLNGMGHLDRQVDGAHRIGFAVVSGSCRTEVVVRYLDELYQSRAQSLR